MENNAVNIVPSAELEDHEHVSWHAAPGFFQIYVPEGGTFSHVYGVQTYEPTGDWEEDQNLVQEEEEGNMPGSYITVPLYAYLKGGVHLSRGRFDCPWDSGQLGWLVIHESTKLEHVDEALRAISAWASGDLWDVHVLDEDGYEVNDAEEYGIIGYDEACRIADLLADHHGLEVVENLAH